MKYLLAAMLAGSFLMTTTHIAKAEDAPAAEGEKPVKKAKKAKKADKTEGAEGKTEKKEEKASW